jgi:poly-gamma-glutamate synthesis protein (capsule biosynthesis protein)
VIFTGDIIFPYESDPSFIEVSDVEFLNTPKIVNFESVLKPFSGKKTMRGDALYSSMKTERFLNMLNVKCVTLANNHIFDFYYDISEQKKVFMEWGIEPIGAGTDIGDASIPYIARNEKIVVLTFGWDVIGCKYAGRNFCGINPYEYKWVEENVKIYRNKYPEYSLVVTFHWNYEFEQYPQPADREFCFHLIEIGVDAVFGHHAHIIQGYEFYNGKPIFYGLGNFYFPNYKYFPETADIGLSVNYNNDITKIIVYITEQKDRGLRIIKKSVPGQCDILNKLSQFSGMNSSEYVRFFVKNRHKRKMLPVYRSYRNGVVNKFYDLFVKFRQVPVELITKLR